MNSSFNSGQANGGGFALGQNKNKPQNDPGDDLF
jgi:hypothetical protein